MRYFKHEKYKVWKSSVDFAVSIDRLCQSCNGPEKGYISTQIRRASVSVASNIAEGAGRGSDKEFIRFLNIAYGSLMEVLTQAEIVYHLKCIEKEHLESVRNRAEEISKMISGLRNCLKKRHRSTSA